MFQIKVDVEGLEGIEDALEKLTTETILSAAAEGMAEGMQSVVGTAKDLVPVDTGELRDSIKAEPVEISDGGVTGLVKANTDHAVFVEMGTGARGAANAPEGAIEAGATYTTGHPGMEAQPYMYPAMKRGEPVVHEAIAAAIKKAVGG